MKVIGSPISKDSKVYSLSKEVPCFILSTKPYFKSDTQFVDELTTLLWNIEGIVKIVYVDRYSIAITIATLFNWADVEPQIMVAFEKFYGEKLEVMKEVELA